SHAGGVSRLEQNDVLTSVVHVLEASDSFLPGEKVSVAFTSNITGADSSPLSPYQLTFQVRPGLNEGGWEPDYLEPLAPDGAVAVLAADFMPGSGAVELLTVSSTLMTLYNSQGRQGTAAVPAGWTFTDAVAVDADANGSVQIVAMLLGSQGELRLQEYRVGDSGSISSSEARLDFATLFDGGEGASAASLYLADLDSDGLPELMALHGDGSFAADAVPGLPAGLGDFGDLGDLGLPVEEEEPESTGYLTIFQLTMGLPADGQFDLNDPENLLELQFVPLRNPISGFDSSRKIQLADLDNDGRLDLVSEAMADDLAAGSLVLYRNQTTSANPFSFRKVGTLKNSAGGDYAPDAWIVFDFDTDGDVDVVSWKDSSALLHENTYRDVGDLLAGGFDGGNDLLGSLSGDEPRGLLFEEVVPETADLNGVVAQRGDLLEASNLDGDPLGSADLVIGGAGEEDRGRLVVLRNQSIPGVGQSFETIELDAGEAGVVSGFALLDLNGDTGLDVATVSDDSPLVYGSLGVQAATVPDPTRYRLQPVDENGNDVTIDDLASLEANDVFGVKVFADIQSSFSGYSVALDYERFELDYLGFTEPSGFEQLALFEACPQDESDNSCVGFATASMTYQQDTTGAAFDNVELGVFRFRCRQVFGRTDTRIGFAPSGATLVSNVLTAVEAGVSQDVPVEVGEAIEFELEPPPPPPLEVSCNVQERGALSSEVLISWQAQALRYDRVKIRIANGPPIYIDWDSGSYLVGVSSPGDVSISVEALLADSDIGPTVICGVVHVPQPLGVTCDQEVDEDVGQSIMLADYTVTWDWDSDAPVDQFRIYRNGVFRNIVLPIGELLYEDVRQAFNGGSQLYEVSAVIDGIESSRGACSSIDPEPCETEAPGRSPVVGTELPRSSLSAPLRIRWDWVNGEVYDLMRLELLFEPADPDSDPVNLFGET
ncbi:MAG: VCBS repeat-containing protein, partial [Planctomycetota bacterium]|nr:VCBS repeat-containing protein [Planctomycetota bacterium]